MISSAISGGGAAWAYVQQLPGPAVALGGVVAFAILLLIFDRLHAIRARVATQTPSAEVAALPVPHVSTATAFVPEPNVRIDDVVKQILNIDKLPLPIEQGSMAVFPVIDAILERAMNGNISVFGGIEQRLRKESEWDSLVRARIDKDYWKTYRIDGNELLTNHRGTTWSSDVRAPNRDTYCGLWFDRREVDAIWPPKI